MVVRGPILNPRVDGSVEWIPDGILAGDARIIFVGSFDEYQNTLGSAEAGAPESSPGIITPPFLDAHIHVPQHPIRGRFNEGVVDDPPEGRLLAGLNRNVFPAEGRFSSVDFARATTATFLRDTLAHGVIGGAAYLTVHPAAARETLRQLPRYWHAGLVLMNQNCPQYLRNDERTIDQDLRALAEEFGPRSIITDRFAVACSSELRRMGVNIAKAHGLRTQTHLNEQCREKAFVEASLYPQHASYTDVYRADGLLDHRPLLAHCIQMTREEWRMLSDAQGAVMHCPTSNLILGSGVMRLDDVREHGLDYAICTDVGASPTTSMLLEMSQFLLVHQGHAEAAIGGNNASLACEALYRVTRAPARILDLDSEIGSFDVGKAMSFIEIASPTQSFHTADEAIRNGLLHGDSVSEESRDTIETLRGVQPASSARLDELTYETRKRAAEMEKRVLRVVIDGVNRFTREASPSTASRD